jgi:hypothetical protein
VVGSLLNVFLCLVTVYLFFLVCVGWIGRVRFVQCKKYNFSFEIFQCLFHLV